MGKDQPTNQQPEVSPLTESEAVRRLEDITRLVSDWVWEVDRDYKIIFISDRVLDVLGYHPRELHGKPLKEIIDFDVPSAKELTDIVRRPFRDKPGKASKKNGDVCHLLISGVPVFNHVTGNFEGVRGTADDVTEKILAEYCLRVARRMSLTVFSEDVPRGLIFCLIHNSYTVTMSQKLSLIK